MGRSSRLELSIAEHISSSTSLDNKLCGLGVLLGGLMFMIMITQEFQTLTLMSTWQG